MKMDQKFKWSETFCNFPNVLFQATNMIDSRSIKLDY